ncbi:hypothetical protein AJ80_09296 [Polytolypa hystricis UAMH7299]|uniref:Beta-xylosidase C-terminal Concanavalin A-like domain-containing protein n=1 Tax=Polytolypa hystricis (strain UAMH7299) TaxID=1447883 RepID=A0A2B7WT26_POLH7|nr:hypothetical protein AJ80_09296 [Polytolypa hystricis UAMH7299]
MSVSHVNPIIPGFAPDPSVARIGDTFFLVNSSFHLFPGLPIFASQDLVSWRHFGNAINRQSQLSLAASGTSIWPPGKNGNSMLSTGGLYAPTIRHHKGITYIVCTNIVRREGDAGDDTQNFILSTRDIWSNEWSDPVNFDFTGIDPSIFFDDDGRSYMQGSASPGPMTKVNLFEIDLEIGKKLSEEKTIWGGTGGIYPEGPHIYKKDGWYYVIISEGGTHEDHMITVARSKDIWGPYESFPENPILTARGTDEYIQFTGHSDIFEDQQGKWWAVCLGVRKKDDYFNMGRETFLTTGEWPEGGWPALNLVKMSPTLADGKELVRGEDPPLTADPLVDFVYIRDAELSSYKFSNNEKTVTITASRFDLPQWSQPVTFIGKRQRAMEGASSVTMQYVAAPQNAKLKAGLAVYKDEHRYARVFYDFAASEMVIDVLNNAKKISRISSHPFKFTSEVVLTIEYTETSYRFSFGNNKDAATSEIVDALDLTGPDFVGPVIGIFAIAETSDVSVQFDNLTIR